MRPPNNIAKVGKRVDRLLAVFACICQESQESQIQDLSLGSSSSVCIIILCISFSGYAKFTKSHGR